jgi:hypothetical protein
VDDGGEGAAAAASPHAHNFFEQVHGIQRKAGLRVCQFSASGQQARAGVTSVKRGGSVSFLQHIVLRYI